MLRLQNRAVRIKSNVYFRAYTRAPLFCKSNVLVIFTINSFYTASCMFSYDGASKG